MYSMIEDDMKSRKLKSNEELFQLRNAILKQRDTIARIILQRKIFKENKFPYYNLAFNLWNIGRNYYNLYKTLSLNFKKADVEYFKKTNIFFFEFFRRLESHKLEDKHKEYENIINKGIDLMKKTPSLIISYCMNILMLMQSCNSHLLMLNF